MQFYTGAARPPGRFIEGFCLRRVHPELLEFGEEVLDQVACLVGVLVEGPGHSAVRLGGDHNGFASRRQRLDDRCVGIESFVGNQQIGLHGWQQVVGADQIMGLSAGQEEGDRVAERIDQGVDLATQPTARSPDRLVLAGFFLAPALCW